MKRLAIAFLAAALLGGAVSPAGADGTKIIIRGGAFPHHRVSVGHPHTKILLVPSTVYVLPTSPRWVPGYWTYQWIPQAYTSWAWIPGHYDPNGYWVEGNYVPQTVQTGYYQPIWISGYWDP